MCNLKYTYSHTLMHTNSTQNKENQNSVKPEVGKFLGTELE